MPLSAKQRARLIALAEQEGVDADELIAEAEAALAEREPAKPAPSGVEPSSAKPPKPSAPEPAAAPATEQPKLFMYHLPFVTVNEVRTKWLGLEPMEGGDENAAAFAARMQGTAAPKPEGT